MREPYPARTSGDETSPVRVLRPSEHAGIGTALRNSYLPAPLPEEFNRLLSRLR